MFECFHCGERAVLWQNDFTFADYDMAGEGLIHELLCTSCGARITYEVEDREPQGRDAPAIIAP